MLGKGRAGQLSSLLKQAVIKFTKTFWPKGCTGSHWKDGVGKQRWTLSKDN